MAHTGVILTFKHKLLLLLGWKLSIYPNYSARLWHPRLPGRHVEVGALCIPGRL